MVFWLAGSMGQMFSGFLQAAAYTNLSGVHGYAGWRWLFIIDGIITVPLAVLGYVFFPNLPQSGQKTWWTSQKEHELSVSRMKAVGRAGTEAWSRSKIKRIVTSWHFWVMRKLTRLTYSRAQANRTAMIYVIWNNGYPQLAMGYWLKSFNKKPNPVPGVHFSVPDINNCRLTLQFQCESQNHRSQTNPYSYLSTTCDQRYIYCRGCNLGLVIRWTLTRTSLSLHLCWRYH